MFHLLVYISKYLLFTLASDKKIESVAPTTPDSSSAPPKEVLE